MKKHLQMVAILFSLVFCNLIYASDVQIVVRESNTNIMNAPSNNATVLTTENFGAMFNYVSEQGDWYEVVVPTMGNGYISKERSMLVGQQPSQQQPQAPPPVKKQSAVAPPGMDARTLQRENQKWREYEIKNLRHVRRVLDKANEGIDGAIESLANALEHQSPQVRSASADALVSLGSRSVNIVGQKTVHRLYLVKSQSIDILARIGDPGSVPYLSRALSDQSVSEEAARALADIPGTEAREALQRHRQQADMQTRMSQIRQQEVERRKETFKKLDLEWSDARTNILTAAWRIAQYKRSMPTDPQEREKYNILRDLFHTFVQEYNETLGENAAMRLLKDNGYTEDILK